jgi:hypothetical protein
VHCTAQQIFTDAALYVVPKKLHHLLLEWYACEGPLCVFSAVSFAGETIRKPKNPEIALPHMVVPSGSVARKAT